MAADPARRASLKPHPKLAHRVIEGRAFIMDPRDNTLHSLNETGTLVWRALAQGQGPEAAARSIAERFEVTPEEAVEDAAAFLRDLRSLGLVVDA